MKTINFLSNYLDPHDVSFWIVRRALEDGLTVLFGPYKFVPGKNRIWVYRSNH